jgi:hypothetical protein
MWDQLGDWITGKYGCYVCGRYQRALAKPSLDLSLVSPAISRRDSVFALQLAFLATGLAAKDR